MQKNRWLLFFIAVAFLTACTSREIHTEITTEKTVLLEPTDCTQDTDCVLHNANYGWGCCWQGACDALDYSTDNWIALNKDWLASEKIKWCKDDCGPAPMCAVVSINTNYVAACSGGLCMKRTATTS